MSRGQSSVKVHQIHHIWLIENMNAKHKTVTNMEGCYGIQLAESESEALAESSESSFVESDSESD